MLVTKRTKMRAIFTEFYFVIEMFLAMVLEQYYICNTMTKFLTRRMMMVQFRRTEQNRTEHVNYVVKRVICQPLNRTFSHFCEEVLFAF